MPREVEMLPRFIASGIVAAVVHGALAAGAGAARAQTDRETIRPFTIHVDDSVLADLKAKLARARIPEPLEGDGWTYGTDTAYLRSLVAYWRDRFDWREQERRLNRL